MSHGTNHLPIRELMSDDAEACAIFTQVNAFRIREYRLAKNMTQEEFANRYGLNVRTLKRWEGEKSTPRFSEAFRKILSDWASGQTGGNRMA